MAENRIRFQFGDSALQAPLTPERTIELAEIALHVRPNHSDLNYFELAEALIEYKDHDDEKFLQSENVIFHTELAKALAKLDDLDQAIKYANRALSLDTFHPFNDQFINALMKLEETTESALSYLINYQNLAPENPRPYCGFAILAFYQGRYDQANQQLDLARSRTFYKDEDADLIELIDNLQISIDAGKKNASSNPEPNNNWD